MNQSIYDTSQMRETVLLKFIKFAKADHGIIELTHNNMMHVP